MRGPRSSLVLALLSLACKPDDPPVADGTTGDTTTSTTTGSTTDDTLDGTATDTGEPPAELDVHVFANGCYSIHAGDEWLARASDEAFGFAGGGASRFFMKASDLGTYLFYDEDGGYLVAEDGPLLRQTALQSDMLLVDDDYVSGAEWVLEPAATDPSTQVWLRNRRTGQRLGHDGLVTDEAAALAVTLESASDCREHPELTLDATGTVTQTQFEDGDLYGIVDTHSHILSNFAFGGGGIFHGAPFHRLGVEHALPDCSIYHGENGRKDFFGYAFDTAGADGADIAGLFPDLLAGELSVDNHATAGYPEFTDWPNAPTRSTHQTQYYRWLERAYLAGLRLVVQHATTNSAICHMTAGEGIQPVRYSCEDMVAVDRIIEETYALERYIDAQSGGPGEGWFRIVLTPAEARNAIEAGKMAVILGIETSDLFDCRITPRESSPLCDEDYIRQTLDTYYERGVRAIFPVHKYDNAFTPGDGDRAFIELGNFMNSGHWSNFTEDCPADAHEIFDHGDVAFGGLNMPRDEYDTPAPNDFSNFPDQPFPTLFPFISYLDDPPLVGDYCQNASLTPLGETLLLEMMARGIIIEIDHLPQWSKVRAFELLVDNDYPAAGTHGGTQGGLIYQLGGISKTGLGRCRDAATPGLMLERLQERIALITANGGYPGEGFGFDLNGFAGAPGPRFAAGACPTPQEDPVTYPFTSYAGDVEFTEPSVGNRVLDFNMEGMVHIGLLPELLEDARRDAVSEADLEPLFRSAEAYIRMWERAEQRASQL
ncbi:amidohydrolase family protein [Paraliomyxa miuraensis]|uniref:membrane dipeptidase n=1 Tax=Paraliomyxa miuraensis TaxID=376150 RepID=UPI002259FFFE|nr:membrane dipeptidase [Paraliomyxa miuraensis]MCX4241989.1 dipeptidase [Paraliomyxa miuraensis]